MNSDLSYEVLHCKRFDEEKDSSLASIQASVMMNPHTHESTRKRVIIFDFLYFRFLLTSKNLKGSLLRSGALAAQESTTVA